MMMNTFCYVYEAKLWQCVLSSIPVTTVIRLLRTLIYRHLRATIKSYKCSHHPQEKKITQ